MHILALERPEYVRERADGLYTPGAYLLYKMVEAAGVSVVVSVVFSVVLFFALAMQVREAFPLPRCGALARLRGTLGTFVHMDMHAFSLRC